MWRVLPSAYTLNEPGALTLDHAGNLFISDSALEAAGNARLLEYDVAALQNTGNSCLFGNSIPAANIHVYDRGGNFSITSSYCPPGNYPCLNFTFQPAFTSDDNVMVVGNYGSSLQPPVITRPLVNRDPQGASPAWTQLKDYSSPAWTQLKDYSSVIFSAAFDKQNNLYTTDLDRSRVLIYFQPFATVASSPTPIASPGTITPTCTPTISPTETVIESQTPSPTPTSTFTPSANCCQVLASASAGVSGPFNVLAGPGGERQHLVCG